MTRLRIEFCGEYTTLEPGGQFVIGREGDLEIDDNPYLHRRFLVVAHEHDFWWLINEGTRLSATVSAASGTQAWLAAGSRIPLVFGDTTVVFSAGPVTYEFSVLIDAPAFSSGASVSDGPPTITNDATLGDMPLTASQRALIVALAEPLLAREGTGQSRIPSSAQAAARLGWSITKFNRKLDNVCDKYDRIGVTGLRGGDGQVALNRKARLVEYAMATRTITKADLPLLDAPPDAEG
ncbi:hypothetical protein SMNI109538_14575 [Smaragdicoccus niigatensis]|nr:hypothetical protein [Smaragdicoccus niigatensis]